MSSQSHVIFVTGIKTSDTLLKKYGHLFDCSSHTIKSFRKNDQAIKHYFHWSNNLIQVSNGQNVKWLLFHPTCVQQRWAMVSLSDPHPACVDPETGTVVSLVWNYAPCSWAQSGHCHSQIHTYKMEHSSYYYISDILRHLSPFLHHLPPSPLGVGSKLEVWMACCVARRAVEKLLRTVLQFSNVHKFGLQK